MNAMARARVTVVWGILLYLVMMGHATAQGITDFEYITRYLDTSYGIWFDSNGDGVGDALAYDVDADGYIDAYRFSNLANGYLNVVVFDRSGNESFTTGSFYVDSNGTGLFDTTIYFTSGGSQMSIAFDPEEDGSYEPWINLSAPVIQSAPAPTETIGGVPVTFFTSSDPSVRAAGQQILDSINRSISIWTAPACTGSYNGCR